MWYGGYMKLFAGVIVFGVIVAIITGLIIKRYDKIERAEMAAYVVIIAWGSLFWGLFLSRCVR
jgi:hypothetical protein